MKLAIIGSRTFTDYDFFALQMQKYKPTTIISGGAKGVDALAKQYAVENSIPIIEILPQFDKFHSKYAPLARNKEIVMQCDCIIAFWDGKSKGTKFVIEYAKKIGKPIEIIVIK